MEEEFDITNFLNKRLEVSYYENTIGENASLLDIGEGRYKIVFEKCLEFDEEEHFIIEEKDCFSFEDGVAFFPKVNDLYRGFDAYIKIANKQEHTNNNKNMKETTIKQLSQELGIDVVYVNGFIQTLVKLGKAEVVGNVERPAGTRGKPSKIYRIAEGIL